MAKRVTAFIAGAALTAPAVAWLVRRIRAHNNESERSEMSEAKQIARRVLEEIFNDGRLEAADELIAPGAKGHDPSLPETIEGPEGVKAVVAGYRAAFPDLRIMIDEQIAEGPLVATRWTARGTHRGDFNGIPPTGRESTVTGITIDRVSNGQIAESWTNWDTFGLLKQLGVVPAPMAQV
jgi:steroid delta-isomerase-like uncharacterized protein